MQVEDCRREPHESQMIGLTLALESCVSAYIAWPRMSNHFISPLRDIGQHSGCSFFRREPGNGFNMLRLRKHIQGLHRLQAITTCRQLPYIPRLRGRIA